MLLRPPSRYYSATVALANVQREKASGTGRNEPVPLWEGGPGGLLVGGVMKDTGGALESPGGQGEKCIFLREEDSHEVLKQAAGKTEA